MYLLDAISFEGTWQYEFDPNATMGGAFTREDGSEVQTRFMYRNENNVGFIGDSVMAARLPYGSGRLEMVAVMPLDRPLNEFIRDLDAAMLDSWINQCGNTSMHLQFPKFKAEFEVKLNDVLSAMGMGDAFDHVKADFRGISTTIGGLWLDEVRHKAVIEIDERGTKAAAVSLVAIVAATMPPKPTDLEFTKPFIYLIRDSKTGAILFMGTMEDPS